MKIRHIYLSVNDRKQLLDLVQEASEELDQVSSNEELDRLENELSDQLKRLIEVDHKIQLNGAADQGQNQFTHAVSKKKQRNFCALPRFGLAVLLALSFVGIQS